MLYRLAKPVFEPKCGGAYKVRLSDDARECVVYLGVQGTEFIPIGSGFLLAYGDPAAAYLVTAAHVAKDLGDDHFVVRFNSKSGSVKEEPVNDHKWHFHQDRAVDIAVLEFSPPAEAKYLYWPGNAIASDAKIHEKKLGAGDLAYVVGMYQLLHGRRRNLPIVHTGHIAMMPGDEPIPAKDWNVRSMHPPRIEVNGYLIEVATLDGTSGSPVFARRSLRLPIGTDDSPDQQHADAIGTWAYGSVWLLGVWHGAWMGEPDETLKKARPPLQNPNIKVPVNMGICMPAGKLIELLEGEELANKRRAKKQQRDQTLAVSPQSVVADDTSASFESVLVTMLGTPPNPRAANEKKPAK